MQIVTQNCLFNIIYDTKNIQKKNFTKKVYKMQKKFKTKVVFKYLYKQ